MGRHEAPVPPERRLLGGALGATTIFLLVWLVWAISQPGDNIPTTSTVETSTTTAATELSTTMTTPPSTTAPPETAPPTTAATPAPPIQLSPDGLGVAQFGDPHDETVDAVAAVLGPPDEDSGWISSISEFGICPGTEVRVVRWASLRLFFSDGPTDFADETRHFFYYNQSHVPGSETLDLQTPTGVGLGSTVVELREAYGSNVTITSTVQFGPSFSVEGDGPGLTSGSLSGIGDENSVTLVSGGFGCGG